MTIAVDMGRKATKTNNISSFLPVSSADNLCKQFGPRSAPTKNVGPDLDPNCLTLCWYFLKNFCKSAYFEKSADNKKAPKEMFTDDVRSVFLHGNAFCDTLLIFCTIKNLTD